MVMLVKFEDELWLPVEVWVLELETEILALEDDRLVTVFEQ